MKNYRVMRTAGWLAVAGLLGAALVGPAAASASVVNYATVSGYADGTPANNHESTWGDDCTKLDGDKPGEEDEEAGKLGPTYVLSQGYAKVIVKAGSEKSAPGHVNTIFNNPTAGQTVWADSNGSGAFDSGDKDISHIIFCGSQTTTTTSASSTTDTTSTVSSETTDTTSTTSSETTGTTSTASTTSSETTGTTSTASTTTGTSSVASETTSSQVSTTSTGTVGGVTGMPEVTPPSTDTAPISGGSSPAGGTWQLLLVAMAGLLAGVLLLTPGTARKR